MLQKMFVDSKISFQKDFAKISMTIYENGLAHYFIKPQETLERENIQEVLKEIEKLGPEIKYLNLFEFSENADVDEETRQWAADSEGNKQTIADAIVIKSLAQKIIGNFYLKFNRPVKPTRIFNTASEAYQWLLEQK